MPLRYRLSSAAADDFVEILRSTEEGFGEQAADRYRALLKAALADLVEDPERAGSRVAVEVDPDARLYHLRHSRERVAGSMRVRTPRHFILYRRLGPDAIGVARLLHDAMDLPGHATGDYGSHEE